MVANIYKPVKPFAMPSCSRHLDPALGGCRCCDAESNIKKNDLYQCKHDYPSHTNGQRTTISQNIPDSSTETLP